MLRRTLIYGDIFQEKDALIRREIRYFLAYVLVEALHYKPEGDRFNSG